MTQALDELNLIKNPRLAEGLRAPRGWRWRGDGQAAGWAREAPPEGQPAVMTVRCQGPGASAGWARRVRCKPQEHYRVEVVVSCRCGSARDAAGFMLSLQPVQDGVACARRAELVAPPRLDEPTVLRAYYHAPPEVNSVELQVGLVRAEGFARIHEVTMFSILEPEAKSHVHAAVPPPYAYPAPRAVRKVCVWTPQGPARGQEAGRPIVDLLRKRFGPRAVWTLTSQESPASGPPADAMPADAMPADAMSADAILIPGDAPPPALAKLPALYALAAERLVVLSLPAFARIAGPACEIRTVHQGDDPIHAKVRCANFITRGFAIADVFPYAWRDRDRRTIVQRHFRRTIALREFCRKHGFETILDSVCNTDAASDRPVCLYKQMDRGGIVVLDVEPAEAVATNFDEPNLACYLLLNVLGVEQAAQGQYVAPARHEKELRDEVAELGQRYPRLVVRGCDHPDKPRRDQFIEVGGEADESLGPPVVPRPLILIRTGLRGDDVDGVYGTMLWLRNLVRPEPHACPYAPELISRFRLAWIPLCAEWHCGHGWRRPDDTAVLEMAAEFEPRALAAVIDVSSTPTRRVRVIVAGGQQLDRYAEMLPDLFHRFVNDRFFYRSVEPGRSIHERAEMRWRPEQLPVEVKADEAGLFDSDFHRQARNAGAGLIRLEFPGPAADLSTGSIWRTDLVATVLEQVIGLQYGWIAMNRRGRPVRVSPPAVGSGAAARVFQTVGSEPVVKPRRIRPGQTVLLRPASALCIAAR